MEKRFFGVMIKIRDMDAGRHFYRTVLGLGDPTADSNIWVEFELPEGNVLVLEKSENETKGNAVRWVYGVNDAETLMRRLGENGYSPKSELADALGFKLYEYADPEGNPFFIYPVPS